MKRRNFLKLSLGGLTAVAMSSAVPIPPIFRKNKALAQGQTLQLTFAEVFHEMVDRTRVYSWAFADLSDLQAPPVATIPGPVILATEGESITISLQNPLDEPHGFEVSGVPDSRLDLPSGGSGTIFFQVPAAGTYIYRDPINAPVNQVLGLHGMILPGASTATTVRSLQMLHGLLPQKTRIRFGTKL